jgi:hypothetical protein
LKPIDEVVMRSNNTKNGNTTINPNATGTKFYVNPANN